MAAIVSPPWQQPPFGKVVPMRLRDRLLIINQITKRIREGATADQIMEEMQDAYANQPNWLEIVKLIMQLLALFGIL
jgi:hypothetical protein